MKVCSQFRYIYNTYIQIREIDLGYTTQLEKIKEVEIGVNEKLKCVEKFCYFVTLCNSTLTADTRSNSIMCKDDLILTVEISVATRVIYLIVINLSFVY